MTREEFENIMRDNDAEFMRFERVKKPRSRRPDLHGMLLLDELQPGEMDIISAAEHDEFWLDIDVDSLSAVITHDQCVELQRCGIRYDEGRDSLAVFT